MNNKEVKILYIDIETKPIKAWVWGLFDQNIGLEQIEEDWCILSFAAKWADDKEVIQHDLRNGINDTNEKSMLIKIWKLLDEADIVVGQNSKAFDVKKLNDQFLKYDLGKPSPFKQEDTLIMSKKNFSPTSHKLEYRSKQLNKKYKKMSHSKYPGFSLWKACINGDQKAWLEMALYNKFDVLATEEYFIKLRPWGTSNSIGMFNTGIKQQCNCGSSKLQKRGYSVTITGKFQRYQCIDCGAWLKDGINLYKKKEREKVLREV